MPADRHGFVPSSSEELLRRRVKAEIRKRMRGLRGAMPSFVCAAKSERICQRVLELSAVSEARSVALFYPMAERREVDLLRLHEALAGRGARVAYPAVHEDTGAMTFHYVSHPGDMGAHALGFPQPGAGSPEAKPGELDAVLVPALAVDPRGHRIGYGAGYYDRALPSWVPPAVAIAVAFDFQLLAELPNTEGDARAAFVVTEQRTLVAG